MLVAPEPAVNGMADEVLFALAAEEPASCQAPATLLRSNLVDDYAETATRSKKGPLRVNSADFGMSAARPVRGKFSESPRPSEPTESFAGTFANLHNLECLRCSPAGCIVPCSKPDILTTDSRAAAVPVFHPLCRPVSIDCPKVQPSRPSRAYMSV